jgi:hypothetical protein
MSAPELPVTGASQDFSSDSGDPDRNQWYFWIDSAGSFAAGRAYSQMLDFLLNA